MKRWLGSLAIAFGMTMGGSAYRVQAEPQTETIFDAVSVEEASSSDDLDLGSAQSQCPCSTCCVETGFGGTFYVEAGANFVRPNWDHNTAYVVLTDLNADDTYNNVNINDFDWDLAAAPRVNFGYTADSGLGAGFRFWKFGASGVTVNLTNPGGLALETHFFHNFPGNAAPLSISSEVAGDNLTISNNVDLQQYDFEISQQWSKRKWKFTAGGGIRYLELNQRYHAQLVNNNFIADGVPTSRSAQQQLLVDFHGAGPTANLALNRHLWKWFSLFGSARGSLLWGENHQLATLTNTTTNLNTGVATTSNSEGHFDYTDMLPISELELGIQTSVPVGDATLFLKTSLVSLFYFNGGAPAVQQGESDLGFFGYSITGGFYY